MSVTEILDRKARLTRQRRRDSMPQGVAPEQIGVDVDDLVSEATPTRTVGCRGSPFKLKDWAFNRPLSSVDGDHPSESQNAQGKQQPKEAPPKQGALPAGCDRQPAPCTLQSLIVPLAHSERLTLSATLADHRGLRLVTLCALYVAQGIPFGFVTVALASYLAEQGASVDAIGHVKAMVTLPWAFKWVWGPVIDRFGIRSMGRRRPWILLAQTLMAVTIAAMIAIPNLVEAISLLATMILIHNIFGSLQDVSVDALAVDLLDERERGRVNGLMYGSAYFGTMVGGAGLGWVFAQHGLRAALLTQVGLLLAIMCLPLFLRERPGDSWLPRFKSQPAGGETPDQSRSAKGNIFLNLARAMTLRSTLLAAALALGMRLGSSALDTIGLEYYINHLHWTKEAYNNLMGGYAVVVGLTGAMAGGFIADRVGAKRLAATTSVLLGAVWIAFGLLHAYWSMSGVVLTMLLFQELLLSILLVSLFSLFMTISWPRVAATQFTAYMALLNLSTTCGSWIAGTVSDEIGITTAFIVFGIVQCALAGLLPAIDPRETRRVLGEG